MMPALCLLGADNSINPNMGLQRLAVAGSTLIYFRLYNIQQNLLSQSCILIFECTSQQIFQIP